MSLRTFLLVLQSVSALIVLTLLLLAGYHLRQGRTAGAESDRAFCGTVSLYRSYRYLPSSIDSTASTDRGKSLWNANACGSCHIKDMVSIGTGPALGGTLKRWAEYPRADLYAWVRNSQSLVAVGHPRAAELSEAWSPVVMSNFAHLSDADIEDLLAFIHVTYVGI